jgi:hypothetical protein
VASTTLIEPPGRAASTLLRGEVAQAVAALRRRGGGDLLVVGSQVTSTGAILATYAPAKA